MVDTPRERLVRVDEQEGELVLQRACDGLRHVPHRHAAAAAAVEAGGEQIRWLPVVEEIRTDSADPATGPFSAASTAADRGLVALRVSIPSTASALASYDAPTTWPPGFVCEQSGYRAHKQ